MTFHLWPHHTCSPERKHAVIVVSAAQPTFLGTVLLEVAPHSYIAPLLEPHFLLGPQKDSRMTHTPKERGLARRLSQALLSGLWCKACLPFLLRHLLMPVMPRWASVHFPLLMPICALAYLPLPKDSTKKKKKKPFRTHSQQSCRVQN